MLKALALAAALVSPQAFAQSNPVGPMGPMGAFDSYSLQELRHNVVMNGSLANHKQDAAHYTVRLAMTKPDGNPGGTCTGFIVANDLIMTAGHCLENKSSVRIHFGLDGESNKTIRDSIHFRGQSLPYSTMASRSPWVDRVLAYDKISHDQFMADANTRQDMRNWVGKNIWTEAQLFDVGLIKFEEGLPKGFHTIRFAKHTPNFREAVTIAGYGYSSRIYSELDPHLHSAQLQIIGHITKEGFPTTAYETYSPKSSAICYGDSGGPATVLENGVPKIIGIIDLTQNVCANSSWVVSPWAFRSWFENAAREMGTTLDFEPKPLPQNNSI